MSTTTIDNRNFIVSFSIYKNTTSNRIECSILSDKTSNYIYDFSSMSSLISIIIQTLVSKLLHA